MSAKIHRSAHFAGGSSATSTTSGTLIRLTISASPGWRLSREAGTLLFGNLSAAVRRWVEDCTGVSSGTQERIGRGAGVYGAGAQAQKATEDASAAAGRSLIRLGRRLACLP